MTEVQTYGHLTVSSQHAHFLRTGETLHVFVDERDVTRYCLEADDTMGYAIVLLRHAGEWPTATALEPYRGFNRYRLHGCVRIEPGEAIR